MPSHRPDRRRFLAYTALTSAALMAGPARIARAQALDGVKVVVVGAGLSGLGAARTLADSGAEVVVVEAQDRIGGRLWTDWSMGAPFEVGAGWIHGPEQANPSKQLADAVGGAVRRHRRRATLWCSIPTATRSRKVCSKTSTTPGTPP
jgi:monoamine oxidase